MKKRKVFTSDYITVPTDDFTLDDDSSWTVDMWIRYKPKTIWQRLFQVILAFIHREHNAHNK